MPESKTSPVRLERFFSRHEGGHYTIERQLRRFRPPHPDAYWRKL